MPPKHQFLAQAKSRFEFLLDRGFRIESEYEGSYASFKDGFDLCFASPTVMLRVAYFDMELDLVFTKAAIRVHYLFIDHNLYANASGLAGCMFPVQKLNAAIDSVAKDIEANYGPILSGEPEVWRRIERLVLAPREAKRRLP